MKKRILFFAMALIASTYFTACTDTEDPVTPTTPTKEETLAGSVSKSWNISKMMINGYDMVPLMDSCDRDNLLIFKRSMVLTFDEGAEKCNPSEPQSEDGSWAFNSDKTKITIIDQDSDTTVGNITELTNSKLVMTTMMDSSQVELTLIAK